MISLREINEDNFDDIIRMKRPPEEKYVASNSYSLAQAWLYRENGDVFPYAVYRDEEPVGFLLLEEDTEERWLCIWRLMFPEEQTCKGYGQKTVGLVLEQARAHPEKYDRVICECAPGNRRVLHVCEKMGFVPTGEISHGAVELEYRLK